MEIAMNGRVAQLASLVSNFPRLDTASLIIRLNQALDLTSIPKAAWRVYGQGAIYP